MDRGGSGTQECNGKIVGWVLGMGEIDHRGTGFTEGEGKRKRIGSFFVCG